MPVIIPVITNQALSGYSKTSRDFIIASCDVANAPDYVVLNVNGKSFALALSTGTTYTATLYAKDIGVVAGAAVKFTAINSAGGVEASTAALTITLYPFDSYDVAAIERELVNILTPITGLNVLAYEPSGLPNLPAVTFFYEGFSQKQTESIDFTVTHSWVMRLYVRLNDAKQAQDQLKSFLKQILQAFKATIDFNKAVCFGIVESGKVGIVLGKSNPVIVVDFTVTGEREERGTP